jgi:hypothetical protein
MENPMNQWIARLTSEAVKGLDENLNDMLPVLSEIQETTDDRGAYHILGCAINQLKIQQALIKSLCLELGVPLE